MNLLFLDIDIFSSRSDSSSTLLTYLVVSPKRIWDQSVRIRRHLVGAVVGRHHCFDRADHGTSPVSEEILHTVVSAVERRGWGRVRG